MQWIIEKKVEVLGFKEFIHQVFPPWMWEAFDKEPSRSLPMIFVSPWKRRKPRVSQLKRLQQKNSISSVEHQFRLHFQAARLSDLPASFQEASHSTSAADLEKRSTSFYKFSLFKADVWKFLSCEGSLNLVGTWCITPRMSWHSAFWQRISSHDVSDSWLPRCLGLLGREVRLKFPHFKLTFHCWNFSNTGREKQHVGTSHGKHGDVFRKLLGVAFPNTPMILGSLLHVCNDHSLQRQRGDSRKRKKTCQ